MVDADYRTDTDHTALDDGRHLTEMSAPRPTRGGEVGTALLGVPDQRRDYRATFVVLCLGVASFALLQMMVSPALPTIQVALHTDQTTATWVVTAYLLSASVCTPIVGRLGDKIGKERMLVVTLAALAAGSVMAAAAASIGVLIAARAVQGLGGGVLPLTVGIIRDELPREKVAGAVGVSAALLAVGGGLGLVVAGPIVETLGFRWLFWLATVLTLTAAVAAHRVIPASPERAPGRVNVQTALLLSTWLVALLIAVAHGGQWGWGAAPTLGLLVAAAVVLPVWVWAEFRSDSPLVDMQVMRLPTVWPVNLVALLYGFGMYAFYAFLTQFVQTREDVGYGFSASMTEYGLLLLPHSIATFVAGLCTGALSRRYGAKRVLVGSVTLTAIAISCIVLWHRSFGAVLVATTLLGPAFGLAFAALSSLIVDAVPQSQTGVAGGLNANIRTIGGALGCAVFAGIVSSDMRPDGVPSESGYIHGFALLVAISTVAVLVALRIPASRQQE